jgi:CBS domain-containing protein
MPLRSVDIGDYLLTDPVTIRENENIFHAIDVIIKNKVSGVCVINDDGDLVGMLSELDCMRAVLGATYNDGCRSGGGGYGNVIEFMSKDVDCCELHADIVDVAADMLSKGHRRRPVLDHGKLVGQITCRRLLSAVSKFACPENELYT